MSTWYEQAVFYHIYPLGMTGAPKTNLEPGITNRFDELDQWIPHLSKLGFNAVYIGPLFESSTHGYDTIDYRAIDRRLGDTNRFRTFTKQCHEHGIRVVVDGVFNHTGREFFAFKNIQEQRENSPYRDWYRGVNFDCGSPAGDSFTYEAWQGHYELPCLNLLNADVRQYLFDVVRYWAETFDIDGIRLDCANVLDFGFMKELRTVTSQLKEDFWLMGEVIHGDYSRWANPEMLHSVTNYELHKSLYSGLNDHNFFEIAHSVKRLETIGPHLYTFLDNHDENRIASKLTKTEHLPLAHLLLLTLPGIPSVYYGGEWGLDGLRSSTSDDALRPVVKASELLERETPLTGYIAMLAHLHTKYSHFHGGRYQELLLTNRQYAFARHGNQTADSRTIFVTAANCDDQEATLHIPVSGGTAAVNLLDDTTLPVTDGKLTVSLAGNQGAIYKITEV